MNVQQRRKLLARVKNQTKLLAFFGVRAYAFDPGIAAWTHDGKRIDFGGTEWAWLEPLLIELRKKRIEYSRPLD